MKIYSLTPLGQRLSHSRRSPSDPAWKIIYYLSKQHFASKEKMVADLGEGVVNGVTLSKLANNHPPIIAEETGVEV